MLKFLYDHNCKRCPLSNLLQPGEIVCVQGKGRISAKGMIIGEAPGREEALHGEPFVGMAGAKLAQSLGQFAISRDEIFITNVVRCRPPNNRSPREKEEAACRIYLDREIAFLKPRVIMTLGNHALRALTGKWGITRYAGKWHFLEVEGYNLGVLPNYHPAFILRQPREEPRFVSIIAEFAKELGTAVL
jgi:DNA polymerase